MVHLFLGLHPKTIRYDPYISVTNIPPSVKAKELGIEIHPEAPVYCVPGRASYVGGDIVADVISSGMRDLDGISLLIDVGTNGEIVLGGKDWMASCSCSAGPAFEGGEVACGMRAMPGAIERISIDSSFGVIIFHHRRPETGRVCAVQASSTLSPACSGPGSSTRRAGSRT